MNKKPKISILYASLTGNTEEMAYLLYKEFQQYDVEIDVDELEMVSAKDFAKNDICVIATYSYDSGDEILPEETMDFFKTIEENDFKGKVFGVLGSGQDFYDDFCGAVDKFEQQFIKAGAVKGSDSLKFEWDISSPEDEEALCQFASNILKTYKEIT